MKRILSLSVGDSRRVKPGHLVRALQLLNRRDLIPLPDLVSQRLTKSADYTIEEYPLLLTQSPEALARDLLTLLSEDKR